MILIITVCELLTIWNTGKKREMSLVENKYLTKWLRLDDKSRKRFINPIKYVTTSFLCRNMA